MKTFLISLLVIVLLGVGIAGLKSNKNSSTNKQTNTGNAEEKKDLIVLDVPMPNEKVSSPLHLQGKARGYWYFEASFPVEILDANGKQLGVMPVQATGDWMTEDFVPFDADLTFSDPTTKTGTLILHKDNPSGDPAREDSLIVPISF